ncbi:unnamed protein product [Effrenium voratum]|nr:unnamed protein product [Effrenium voratum]
MGCNNSKDKAARAVEAVVNEPLKGDATPSETARLMEEGDKKAPPVLVQASQPLLSTSGNKETQKIIDEITKGEDFETNRLRCLDHPEQAYYSLSAFAHLEIEMIEARNLIPSVTSSFEAYVGDEPDGFVKVFVDDCFKYSTATINNDRNPRWQDKQKFDIVADLSIVRLHVYDSDSTDNSSLIDPIGFVEFRVADIPFDEEIEGWLELRFPGNLQGVNSDRYYEHMNRREEEMEVPMSTKPNNQPKNQPEGTGSEALEKDVTVVEAAKIKTSFASRMFKRIKATGGSLVGAQKGEEPPSDTQFNAGEIHVKLKLTRLVSPNSALFAKALVPSYMTFATFIQEEFLPKLDVQELLDDAMDIKIEIVDEMLMAVLAFIGYVLAWRSVLISGLLFTSVVSGAKNIMFSNFLWYLWVALVLFLTRFESWRAPMSTNGNNARLNDDGLKLIARTQSVTEMNNFLIRMVTSQMGTINSLQDLVHFAGTIVQGDGEVTVTYDKIMKALHDLWFLDFPAGGAPIVNDSLVRVNDRRRGTVAKIKEPAPNRTKKVVVEFDEPDYLQPGVMSGEYEAWDVQIRPSVPNIPRMFVPKDIQGLVASLQFEVDNVKKSVLPAAESLRAFFGWQRPMWMYLLILILLFRSYLSLEGFLEEDSWCHFAITVFTMIRNGIAGLLVIAVLVGQARIWGILRGMALMAYGKCFDQRQAPKIWKFYKGKDEPYRVQKQKTE